MSAAPSRHIAPARVLLPAIPMLLVAVITVRVLAQGFGPAGPSPATGHASVVSGRVISLNEGKTRWYIGTLMADNDADPITFDAPGFLIGDDTPVLVTIVDTGVRVRLAR